MKRRALSSKKDKKVFKNTARKTKSVNLTDGQIPRGGIRF